ncbi:MAG: DUF3313 domain-containing protein [Planctomycetota bacterium]|jgi:hypothetical protein
MNKTSLLMVVVVGLMAMIYGCGPEKLQTTGFLSDYSKLEAESETELRYFNPRKPLGNYSKFIIDPITVHFHSVDEGTDISSEELAEMRQYMYNAVYNAILKRYSVVRQPGPGVARLRLAITDLDKSSPALNVIPQTKLIGVGLGGASMEGELLDSVTGEQIVAVIQSQKGERLSLDGLSKWGDAKAVIDHWAEELVERLEKAHKKSM